MSDVLVYQYEGSKPFSMPGFGFSFFGEVRHAH